MQPSESISRLQPSREKPLGFSRDKRLLTGKAYKQVFDQARRVGNPYWTVYGWRHKEAKAELGLAIAKKHCVVRMSVTVSNALLAKHFGICIPIYLV